MPAGRSSAAAQMNAVLCHHQMAGRNSFSFDVVLFRRFWHLSKILFPGFSSVTSLLLFFLLTLALLEQYIIYNVGLIASGYYKVLGDKDLPGFWHHTFISLGIICAVAVVKGTRQFITSTLYLAWRQVLCHAIHRLYFSDILYYKLNVLQTNIDNPDQRITQDVDKMCSGLSTIFPALIVAPFTISYYSYQAYNSTGIAGPLVVFGFFLVSTVVNKLLMSPIVRLVVQQEKREGNFRFKHMQVRANAESLAFCGTSNAEYLRANQKLNELITTQKSIVNWKYGLQMAINIFDYLGSLVSYFLLAYPIFTGKYEDLTASELGALISKNAFITMYLISCFSSLVDLSVNVTDIAGSTHRIAELLETLMKLKCKRMPTQFVDPKPHHAVNSNTADKSAGDHDNKALVHHSVDNSASDHDKVLFYNSTEMSVGDHAENVLVYKLQNVTIQPPNSTNILVKELTINFPLETNILIMGNSSSGKTSLVRLLRGLWQPQSGCVQQVLHGGLSDFYFLPAQPFLTDGTLREQVIYPLKENDADFESLVAEDVDILNFLSLVGMSSLVERTGGLDEPILWNWEDVLSPGEMQRLGFVRLFYHQPQVAVLDEATSAVSLEVEDQLYRECMKRGITLISVGHRESLKAYHSALLYLDGKGGWTYTKIELPDRTDDASS